MTYHTSEVPYQAFSWEDWHPTCTGVRLMPNEASGVPWVVCESCRCVAQLDLVCHHITPESSMKAREVPLAG